MLGKINIYNSAFAAGTFFLFGVAIASFSENLLAITIFILLLCCYFFLINKKYFLVWSVFAVLGAAYFALFSYFQAQNTNIPFNETARLEGIVQDIRNGSVQQLEVSLVSPYKGNIHLSASRYPEFNYGDKIAFTGTVKELEGEYKNYYLSKNILGEVSFPKVERVSKNNGGFIKSNLFAFRDKIREVFNAVLPKEKAAFLAGITIGSREDFSKEFKDKMALSGTTHLVALSGYNISIVIVAASAFFASIFGAGASFYLSILAVILFVIMTGAEASVVRAAIMGIIMVVSQRVERLFDPRNVIVAAAVIMTLFNPRVLMFDVGFHLSFAALLGIVYAAPVLENIFGFKTKGWFSWKENMIMTVSAQLMALPILLYNFGIFSLASILANILILQFIPVTMSLGFLIAFLGLFSIFLAKVLGFLANLFISYEFFIINLFAKFSFSIEADWSGFWPWVVYYSAILAFILFAHKKYDEKRI